MKQEVMRPNEADTRGRIISAAVKVFARSGFDAGTVREITEIAEVNIAAVNYHFRSKDELIKFILVTGLESIIRVRSEFLHACIERFGARSPTVEALSEALVRPLVELASGQYRDVMMLLMHARTTALGFVPAVVEDQFAPLHEEFVDVLQKALPKLSRTEIALRYDCARGAVLQTLVKLAPAVALVSGVAKPSSLTHETTVKRLVGFVAAGLAAPPT